MRLVGANTRAKVRGEDELPGKSNYFIGNEPKKWRTNVPNYAKVKYRDVYPGVDLVYYGNQRGQLEYDFVVAPGADPSAIALAVVGQDSALRQKGNTGGRRAPLQIAANGDLVVKTDGGEIRFGTPVVYQSKSPADRQSTIDNRQLLEGRYRLVGKSQVGFEVAAYDHTKPLFIDPVLSYFARVWGSGNDYGTGVAVDGQGNAYYTGTSGSFDFPTSPGAFQTQETSGGQDCFVVKLDPTGKTMLYSTLLGGGGGNGCSGIAVDSSGDAYVAGFTNAIDFPTVNPLQATCTSCTLGSGPDAFVTKHNAQGSALIYSTYLGGNSVDMANAIAVDALGNAYVAGTTGSADFPTVNPFQTLPAGAFLTKINAEGSALVYSTYLGGSDANQGAGVVIDSSGDAYVLGSTNSPDFPTTHGAFDTSCGTSGVCNGTNAHLFVTKFSPAGNTLIYSTYLGGSLSESPGGIAVNKAGEAYVTGMTLSSDFPTTKGVVQPQYGGTGNCCFGWGDAFVTELSADGSSLVFSSYLGGSNGDTGMAIALDGTGNIYLAGGTASSDFPVTADAFFDALTDFTSAPYFSVLSPSASQFLFSTYLDIGGSYGGAYGVTVDPSGNAYVTGDSYFMDTGYDALVGKVSFGAVVSLAPTALAFPNQVVGTTSGSQTVTVTNSGSANLIVSTVSITGTNASDFATQSNSCAGASIAPNGTCLVALVFKPSVSGIESATLSIADNALSSPQSVPLSGTGQDFSFAPPSGSPTSDTVAPGSPATYTLSVGGVSGFSGSVAFTCTGAPSEATCSVSPNPVTAGSTATNIIVTVTTNAPSLSTPRSRPLPPVPPPSPGVRGLWILALTLAAMAWAIRGRNQAGVSRWRFTMLRIATGFLLMLALAECGGGGGGSSSLPPNPGTPAGTYTLTVTGTTGSGSSALSHSVTLTLTVS
jgi:hypothetical protein